MKSRIYYFDHLRTLLIFLVVVLHCGLVYESVLEKSWIVVDPVKADWIGLIRMYLNIFVMFTLFFISGYFIKPSFEKNSHWQFIKSKFTRIMLPWIFAVLTMIPLYKILFLYSRGLPQEPWYTYFHIYNRPGGDPYFYADNPVMNWLWFLPILFFFQLLYVMLRISGVDFTRASVKFWTMLTLFGGLAYSMTTSGLGFDGWYHSAIFHFEWNRLLVYFLVFLLGTVVYENKATVDMLDHKKRYILINVVLTISITIFTATALNLFFNLIDPARDHYFLSPGADRTFYYLSLLTSMLSFIYILVYSFKAYANKTNTLWNTLSKNSYFVYIIHLVVLGVLAVPFLDFKIPAGIKFLILALSTWVISNALVYFYTKIIHPYVKGTKGASILVLVATIVTLSVYGQQFKINKLVPNIQTEQEIGIMGIHEAAATGNLDAIKQHINLGSDLNLREPSGGSSPLITASLFGQTEVALLLIESDINLDFQNNDGSTALHTAAFFGRVEIVKALMEAGIDAEIRNKDGSTALDAVSGPYESLKPVYDYFNTTFNLQLTDEQLIKSRGDVKKLLESYN
ncbi:MAG: acyltransferase family protein [Saprospiraceae bacterium]|nr:acyltransferase family protein [Saprospiraceae bacterium]